MGARFGNAALRGVIYIDQAKALRVSVSPLEIVHQRPDEIAAHVVAALDPVQHRIEIAAEIVDAIPVIDRAVGPLRRSPGFRAPG